MTQFPAIFGEVLFDCFEDGSRVLGGAPFNVAWHLQAFGCKPLLISRVGDDPMGRRIRDTMLQWGMSAAGLQLDPDRASGEVRVTLQAGQPTFDIVEDRAYDHIDAGAIPRITPSLVYHGTLALRSPESAAALNHLLQSQQAPVFMDVNLRPPWWNLSQTTNLLEQAKWVKVNDAELDILVDGPATLEAKAERLLERYDLSWLVVTRGKKGAMSLDSAGNLLETNPPAETRVVDTVGAGDAFASVCILGLHSDWPYGLIIERAQRFAAVLVGSRGATLDDPELYNALLAEWL
ncbi:MAG: carbohydrate kinase [Gammaproteobacteria bacterium]|nr:carbohydrate kinase [Gammaproteobacteria bacterium]